MVASPHLDAPGIARDEAVDLTNRGWGLPVPAGRAREHPHHAHGRRLGSAAAREAAWSLVR